VLSVNLSLYGVLHLLLHRTHQVKRSRLNRDMAALYQVLLLVSSCGASSTPGTSCCSQQLVSGVQGLDGVYSLVEDRALAALPPQDRGVCESGCVYTRSGGGAGEEYCFKAGADGGGSTCSAVGKADSLLIERSTLKEELSLLNSSHQAGAMELEVRRRLAEEVEAAREKVTSLLQSPSRKVRVVREEGGCGSVLTLLTSLNTALGLDNLVAAQAAASGLTSTSSVTCTVEEQQELSIDVQLLTTIQAKEEQTISVLEQQLGAMVEALQQIKEQLEVLEVLLVEEMGVTGFDMEGQVDNSLEVPLVLGERERMELGDAGIEEMPIALTFIAITI